MSDTQQPPTTIASEAAPKKSGAKALRASIFAALIALIGWYLWHKRASFDWRSLGPQLRSVSVWMALGGIAIIYVCYWLRAMRWSVLLKSLRPASTWDVLPAQIIGFTAVALFGRLADLARPYIIARQLETPVTTQLAVYSVERAFDLGAAAILFSLTLAFGAAGLPHHEAFTRAGVVSALATLIVVVFAVALRLGGDRVAALAGRVTGKFSPKFGAVAEARLMDLQTGFQTLATFGEFAAALALSLLMWAAIALAYMVCARAFRSSPSLLHFGVAATMLLMATSIGGSVFQLPVVGWFTQIAVLAAALHGFFDVPLETATACGAIMFVVTYLAVIPAGVLFARLRGMSLRGAAHSAENAPTA
ncbi:MAG TPA: lysylphosphatidylglycerol synthase transmembrane domain-containing protein [Candidatus Aquilonibacter sp.]|nr:lysylphosphatidylglycerol synthase transmembrane domain-containing protein [Candidatus Aquilonibacter sp.]